MAAPPHRGGWLLFGAACAYALGAAATTPFTAAADILTAVPIAAMAVVVLVWWPRRVTPVRPAAGEGAPAHPYALWVVVLAVFAGWELFNYLAPGTRAEHPTLSSMTDAVDRYYPLKALLFLGWLRLGWSIVRRGARLVTP